MSNITASMVKELRDKTGAGMMDAKKALVESDGDIEKAVDFLRTKGLAKAAKKSSRTAAEGLVAVATEGNRGAAVEINSETDFVARNSEFQSFVQKTAQIALEANSLEELAGKDFGNGKSVQETLTSLIAKIGENMALRRMAHVEVDNGFVASYVHGALAPGLGKIGVLAAIETDTAPEKLEESGKQIAMHIAAANPQFLDQSSVDADALEREKSVLAEQARASGKPEDIIEKMMHGRLRKYYEEVCLVDQKFVMDQDKTVGQYIADEAKNEGGEAKIATYVRFQLGEGIEREEEDFAAEVAKAANA